MVEQDIPAKAGCPVFSYAKIPCYLQYQMVELGIFKVNQSVIWNGKQTDTTKEKRNNHARIHFTFNSLPRCF